MKLLGPLPGLVMAWTLFFMTFTWTPTMRALLKPEISSWALGGLSGSGVSLSFMVLPLLALYALFLFYLYGRGRLRVLFHVLLLVLHVGVTSILTFFALRQGSDARFIGAAWGFNVPFTLLAIPFGLFTVLTVVWIVAERQGLIQFQERPWSAVGWKKLLFAAALLPVSMLFFGLGGDTYDGWVRLGIVVTIVQWITLAEALSEPPKNKDREIAGAEVGSRTDASTA